MPTLHTLLTDFGLTKTMTTKIVGSRTLKAGTPGFIAPEQMKAEGISEKCDVYAVGCVIIVLFSGKPLWQGLQPNQIMYKVAVEKEKPAIGHIEYQAICEMVDKCLCYDAESRPVCEELVAFFIGLLQAP